MNETAVIERVRRVSAVRAAAGARRAAGGATGPPSPELIRSALEASSQLRSWLAAADAELTACLAPQVSFPEKEIADCTRSTLNEGAKAKERADTLGKVPAIADALGEAAITPAHVDAITRAGKSLDDDSQRSELFDRVDGLVGVASAATVEEFRRRLSLEVKAVQRDDGMARLERQRRNARVRTWTDSDGMWRFSGQFDPVTGVRLAARLDAAVEALFAESQPDTCPSDPIEKQHHLRALAFARLVGGDVDGAGSGTGAGDGVGVSGGVGVRPGRPEFVVVIDASAGDGAGGPQVDWGIPVEIPGPVVAEMSGEADVHAVVIRNGVVIHAPGRLDLGRTTRLANRAQRRALRALYRGCAIPGCTVPYDRCKLHHVIWWRNGGRTDLDNLLPICTHHHGKVHDAGWEVTLGPQRELTITFPDGTIHNTGPPSRQAA